MDHSTNDLFVADKENRRVDKFDSEGRFLEAWGFGVADGVTAALQTCGPQASPPTVKCRRGLIPAAGPAGAIQPSSIAVEGATHDVYVTEAAFRRVTKFTASGEFLYTLGKGVDQGPHHPGTLCTAAFLAEGDACGGGEEGAGAGEYFASAPSAVIVDSGGRVWVKDGNRVDQFEPSGSFVSQATIPLASSKGLARAAGGDFYTIKPGVKFERQEATFSGFAPGDEFSLGNLPGACSASATGPIAYAEGEAGAEAVRQALASACGAANVQVEGTPPALKLVFFKALGYQNLPQVSCARETGSGSCATSTLSNGAPGLVEALEPSGSPVSTLTVVSAPYSGGPESLTLDEAGNLIVGDAITPYHFARVKPSGQQISGFGGGQVIVVPAGEEGPVGNALATGQSGGREALYVASSQIDGPAGQPGPASVVQRFEVPEEGPLIEAERAGELQPKSAVLHASLNPEGHETTYRFEYGLTIAYGQSTPLRTLPGSGFAEEEVSEPVAGLAPGTEYHFRLVATNDCHETPPLECHAQGEDATFTTPTTVGIDGEWASEVGTADATLKALIDPRGQPASWWVEYGPTESYGSSTPVQALAAGFGDVGVQAVVSGLSPGTTYHYRFVAEDEVAVQVHGADHSIATRTPGPFGLADTRAWEMVTPARKGSGRIVGPWLGTTEAAEEGGALTYVTSGATGGGEGNRTPDPVQSLARRAPAGGWRAEEIGPAEQTTSPLTAGAEFRAFSTDLSLAAVEPRGQRAKGPSILSEEASERTPFLRDNTVIPGRWRPLVTGKEPFANVPPGTEFGGTAEEQLHEWRLPVQVAGASPDLRHVILSSSVPLTEPDAEGVRSALYEWEGGALSLVSRLPGGQAAVGVLGSAGVLGKGSSRHAVSADGRYVYWSGGGAVPSALYLRDTVAGKTVRLDVPGPGASGGSTAPVFQGASADGRRAFFTDTQALSEGSGESGADLYACAVGEGAGGPECALTDLTPETAAGEAAEVLGFASGIDEAGDSVYFVANGALTPGSEPGDCTTPESPGAACNLYHAKLEAGVWATHLVARLSNADWPDWAGTNNLAGTASLLASGSPNGRYLAFMSKRSLTGYDNTDVASGEADEEVYRYDAQRESLACVSCDPSGARPQGAEISNEAFKLPADWHKLWPERWLAANLPEPGWGDGNGEKPNYQPRSVLDDGRVLFTSYDKLVSGDVNGTADAYQYEPWGTGSCTSGSGGAAIAQAQGEGCVALLSSGESPRESSVLDASASGEDVFLLTASRLSVLDEDSDYDIYDARVGGVTAQRPEPEPCGEEAGEEVCQPPVPAPGAAGPGTAQGGAGNVREVPPHHKKKHKKKHKKHKHRKHGHRRTSR